MPWVGNLRRKEKTHLGDVEPVAKMGKAVREMRVKV
jgi:hypothetical protein